MKYLTAFIVLGLFSGAVQANCPPGMAPGEYNQCLMQRDKWRREQQVRQWEQEQRQRQQDNARSVQCIQQGGVYLNGVCQRL